jgi:hypothetical protein
MINRVFKNVVAQFIGRVCLINQATTEYFIKSLSLDGRGRKFEGGGMR